MNNVTRLFDGKDVIIETNRNIDSLRRRAHSFKFNVSTHKTMVFDTPMGLSFAYVRATGARDVDKRIVQLWGSAVLRMLKLN